MHNVDGSLIGFFVAFILIILGFIGIFLPVIPGTGCLLVGFFVCAWADHFHHLGWKTLTCLTLMSLISLCIDFVATAYGARRAKASQLVFWGSIIGTLVGLFFLPLGLFVGPFIGAWLGEYIDGKSWTKATRTGLSTWLGILFGIATKLALSLAMVALCALVWFWSSTH